MNILASDIRADMGAHLPYSVVAARLTIGACFPLILDMFDTGADFDVLRAELFQACEAEDCPVPLAREVSDALEALISVAIASE